MDFYVYSPCPCTCKWAAHALRLSSCIYLISNVNHHTCDSSSHSSLSVFDIMVQRNSGPSKKDVLTSPQGSRCKIRTKAGAGTQGYKNSDVRKWKKRKVQLTHVSSNGIKIILFLKQEQFLFISTVRRQSWNNLNDWKINSCFLQTVHRNGVGDTAWYTEERTEGSKNHHPSIDFESYPKHDDNHCNRA